METIVIFLETKTRQNKISRIFTALKQNYIQGHKILIMTPNQESADFIDECIWGFAEEEFLPHRISNNTEEISKENVLITTTQKNLNQASVLINLCGDISPIFKEFKRVYELMDHTHSAKLLLSKERLSRYEAMGIIPERR